ncbi:ROK family protein [Paenibacillus sp. MCAF20]
MRIGAIEAGGTKFICGVGNERGDIFEKISFRTTSPEETLGQAVDFFQSRQVEAIGIGSFGPINLQQNSPKYGFITTTPKLGWSDCNVIGMLSHHFKVPFGWDTDVNAAALGEASWGAAKGLNSCAYYTIGTGIGLGVFIEGRLVHGIMHPEGGHIAVKRHESDTFDGNCPYHQDCLEGMAAGPAIEARWNRRAEQIPEDHEAWEMEAYYIAQALVSTILTLSPEKIILGGGVMNQSHLFASIRKHVQRMLNGYLNIDAITSGIDQYIVPPALRENAGICGALALGIQALKDANK